MDDFSTDPTTDQTQALVTTPPAASRALPPLDDNGGSPPRGPRTGGSRFLAMLGVIVLGFLGGVGGFLAADQWFGGDGSGSGSTASLQPSNSSTATGDGSSSTPVAASGGSLTPGAIYTKVSPAVVHINAEITTTSSFFGIPQQEDATGTGSGFVIDKDGYIVTNAHVVENAKQLNVIFGSDAAVPAKLVGLDKSTDVAVIKIDPDAKQLSGPLTTVAFGDSEQVKVGDPVVAIGNPFSLDRTLTTGVVSALQRDIPSLNDYKISDVIQTDAAVNPGNSGGPLLNMRGEVIGINSQIQSKSGGFDGIAFAVPSDKAKEIAQKLIKDGAVKHAWFGISGTDLTADVASKLNLDVKVGVVVAEVAKGSPADKGGLAGGTDKAIIGGDSVPIGGDIITKFDGKDVTTMRELADIVDTKQPGDKIDITYLHGGKQHETTVTLGDRPDTSAADKTGGQ